MNIFGALCLNPAFFPLYFFVSKIFPFSFRNGDCISVVSPLSVETDCDGILLLLCPVCDLCDMVFPSPPVNIFSVVPSVAPLKKDPIFSCSPSRVLSIY
ncbi:hypothetical protein XELAEV_18031430mg [Xenopus laevis]|uniref:Uncharacterized protein n=1 Tax=Xenopus laevis TaxID=8355 RepID=A0A974CNR7_XENLA|nr:hypothetical protein XELAEV_18031430mg [Xenopus laevis]